MTRDLNASVLAELPKSEIQVALLVSLDFVSGMVRVWSGVGTLTFEGVPFLGVGHLGNIAPISESATAVAANTITLQLSGVPSSLLALALTQQYQGRAAKVWVAFFTPAWVLLDSVLLFAGRMDTMHIDEGPETSVITVSAESQLTDLKRPRVRRYTHADQQQLYPGDMGLEYVEALQNVEIAWGPGPSNTPPVFSSGTGGGSGTPADVPPPFYGEPGGGSGGMGPGDSTESSGISGGSAAEGTATV